jgi:uncharacterized SAM-binding protein YcdF (DUF218 family)
MERAIELCRDGISRLILPSGGPNPRVQDFGTEWEYLHKLAVDAGVPEEALLKEDRARNTFENARLSRRLLDELDFDARCAVLVCKAPHSPRALMTYQTEFTTTRIRVSPIVDERYITRYNWMTCQSKIEVVMTEVEKIGKYFGKRISLWAPKTGS